MLLLLRIGVVAAEAQREADRDAVEVEGLAQVVDEVALIALENAGDGMAEQDEERRSALGWVMLANFHPPPGDGRGDVASTNKDPAAADGGASPAGWVPVQAARAFLFVA